MTVTVLGAGGFIGAQLVRHLRAAGVDCQAPPRHDTGWLRRPLGHVVYAIGLTADFRARPLDTVEAHVCLLRRLLAEGDFESLTYLSSTRVYSGASATHEAARLVVDPNAPGDLYNLSKLMGESLCLHGGRACTRVARLSNIVGLRPDPDIFIDQLLAEGCRSGRVQLRTALASYKDYLWIDDAVALLARMAVSDQTGIFNVASGEAVSNARIAEAIERGMGFAVTAAPDAPAWDFMPIAMARTRQAFPFTPLAFDAYFPDYLRQYRRSKGL
ncbi:MAG TPA: NAD(P)-dependent oxidoreductase [Pseudorhodoferax sp.]|nr:NAD(P)-dependent oxidoreductase [Pseudorhodoferax sp.]